jgi:segregation and condensation protein B
MDTGNLQRDVEALLFVTTEAISIKGLAKLTHAEESDVTVALQKIDEEFSGRGIVLREIAGGYRFATSPAAREAVEAYLMPPKTNLSPAALETLAIVAYMQPVTKGEVEGIRGVSADSVINTLVDRRFLTEAGKRDTPGRPIIYKTTDEFLEAFGLPSLGALPPVEIDMAMPIELALPMDMETTAAEPADEAVADEAETTVPEEVTNDEPADTIAPDPETTVDETAAEPEDADTSATSESEPQPSAV